MDAGFGGRLSRDQRIEAAWSWPVFRLGMQRDGSHVDRSVAFASLWEDQEGLSPAQSPRLDVLREEGGKFTDHSFHRGCPQIKP